MKMKMKMKMIVLLVTTIFAGCIQSPGDAEPEVEAKFLSEQGSPMHCSPDATGQVTCSRSSALEASPDATALDFLLGKDITPKTVCGVITRCSPWECQIVGLDIQCVESVQADINCQDACGTPNAFCPRIIPQTQCAAQCAGLPDPNYTFCVGSCYDLFTTTCNQGNIQ